MRARSHAGHTFQANLRQAIGAEKLLWQRCNQCDLLQYPPAELCRVCLSADLQWRTEEISGEIVSCAAVHRSYAEDFVSDTPWWVASVVLPSGAICYVHVLGPLPAGTKVHLFSIEDRLGDGVLGAVTEPGDRDRLQAKFKQLK